MIIGIDLGTTNSVAAYMKDNKPCIINNAEGTNTTPSAVSFSTSGQNVVGDNAKGRKIREPKNTVWSVKRLMGKKFHEIANEIDDLPYRVLGKDDEIVIDVCGRKYSIPEISAEVLMKIKNDAEATLGEIITKAVITVPAYFSDNQREATRLAGTYANLDVVSIISEPTAAALAYGLDNKENKTIAVYDLGGGTFDISILKLENGMCTVLSTNGNTLLGGDNIDKRISDWILSQAKQKLKLDILAKKQNPVEELNAIICLQHVRNEAEKAKIAMSEVDEYTIEFENFYKGTPLSLKLTKENFNHICHFVTNDTFKCCQTALDDAHLTKDDIDEVILVGGSTKSTFVREEVEKFFGKKPNTSINPDEAVALGAAIQAGILEGQIQDIKLTDVTPLSLGIWTANNTFIKLIEKNTVIPVKKSGIFTTSHDGMDTIKFPICQGENANATQNTRVGTLFISGIEKAPARIPKIKVDFEIDKDGIVKVSATDLKNGVHQSVILQKKFA